MEHILLVAPLYSEGVQGRKDTLVIKRTDNLVYRAEAILVDLKSCILNQIYLLMAWKARKNLGLVVLFPKESIKSLYIHHCSNFSKQLVELFSL